MPEFKKGEGFKALNYQPGSLTCICLKLVEHVVVSHMMRYFDGHATLEDCEAVKTDYKLFPMLALV